MPTSIAEARTQFRELTNERDSDVIGDSVIDGYIQQGLEALNRRVRYHYTTTTNSITLVAGTQEYDLPSELVELKWVEWDGVELTKSSVEEWRRKNRKWRQLESGALDEWAIYANKLVFSPAPNAAVVTEASGVTLRFVSRPGAFGSAGMGQLNYQDWDLPIYYAIHIFCMSYPDSAIKHQMAEHYYKMFEREAEAVSQYYTLRGIAK